MTEPAVLLHAADVSERRGYRDHANELLQEILVDHPGSDESVFAQKQLEMRKETTNVSESQETVTRIQVVDMDIPFTSLVWLFGKAAFAIVPAGIVVWLFWEALSSTLPGMLADALF